MNLGQFNHLEILRITSVGMYLGDEEGNDVLLPNKYLPEDKSIGDFIDVFIYKDSEDRLIATNLVPYIQLHDFACLKVKDVSGIGAFMDWGLEKDLLVPFREQKDKMKPGKWYIVYLRKDEVTERLVATAKLHKVFEKEEINLTEGQEVDLLIGESTDIGIEVVVHNKYRGLLFKNELFKDILFGDKVRGFIKNVREDGKVDVSLRRTGMEYLEDGAEKILKELNENEGYLALDDKSDPEEIQLQLEMSKKQFKRSLGILYKKKIVKIEPDGIHLIN